MIADDYREIWVKEAQNVYSADLVGADGASLSLVSCTVTLTNPDGAVIFADTPATGLSAPGNTVYAWYFVDARPEGLGLTPDANRPYLLKFVAVDGSGQRTESVIELLVKDDSQ